MEWSFFPPSMVVVSHESKPPLPIPSINSWNPQIGVMKEATGLADYALRSAVFWGFVKLFWDFFSIKSHVVATSTSESEL